MKRLNKKGAYNLDKVGPTFLALVLIAVFAFSTYLILAGLQTSVSDGNDTNQIPAESAITNFTSGIDQIVSYAPTWGTIIGVAVLIGIVLVAFSFGRRGGGGVDRAL